MLNDILDLCIEKSDGGYFYGFTYSGACGYVSISKTDSQYKMRGVWFKTFTLNYLESALKLMENE